MGIIRLRVEINDQDKRTEKKNIKNIYENIQGCDKKQFSVFSTC